LKMWLVIIPEDRHPGARGTLRAGDVYLTYPDDQEFGRMVSLPWYLLIKVPASATNALGGNPAAEHTVTRPHADVRQPPIRRRRWSLDLDAIPEPHATTLLTTGVLDATVGTPSVWAQALRSLMVDRRETPALPTRAVGSNWQARLAARKVELGPEVSRQRLRMELQRAELDVEQLTLTSRQSAAMAITLRKKLQAKKARVVELTELLG
jgi:hypothetical protein